MCICVSNSVPQFVSYVLLIANISTKPTTRGFCTWGERLGSTLNATRKMGIYSQRAGQGSVDEKLLRCIIKDKERF